MAKIGSFIVLTIVGLVDGSSPALRQLMVNGVNTIPGEYPFHTQVGCCSGALIAPDVVLTAGHVVPPASAVGMTVTVGAYFSSVTATQGDPRTVTHAVQHPNYDSMHNDFCILILDQPSEKQPVRINRSSHIPNAYDPVTLLGTGTFNLTTSERSEVLQETEALYIPPAECSEAYDPERGISYGGGFMDDTNICTKGKGDGCVFDSGGPVIVGNETLVGLISFGVDCNDPIYPAVNARVSAVSEWIDSVVCQYSADPPEDYACAAKTQAMDLSPTNKSELPERRSSELRSYLLRWPTCAFLGGILLGTVVALLFLRFWKRKQSVVSSVGERQMLLDTPRY
ncbi:trypsin [Nitzschia inconspicua]|uniref:Trypsin n=1 Tax=Nitzschia inconspicua TaxID=303405 RepID=A0A9K3PZ80_9STRA|nr:trypsin [Nitzschia inconspicua]